MKVNILVLLMKNYLQMIIVLLDINLVLYKTINAITMVLKRDNWLDTIRLDSQILALASKSYFQDDH